MTIRELREMAGMSRREFAEYLQNISTYPTEQFRTGSWDATSARIIL